MRILVIGATGTLGRAVAAALEEAGHEVVRASRGGPVRVDLTDPASLDRVFTEVTGLAAVVCCAAGGPLLDLVSATDEEFLDGLRGKLLGQVGLARRAARHLPEGGSITLTGGTFAAPLAGGSLGALVNQGLTGFVGNAAAELPRSQRINLVSPGWIRETLEAMGADGSGGTPAAQVARAYLRAVHGPGSGEVIEPW